MFRLLEVYFPTRFFSSKVFNETCFLCDKHPRGVLENYLIKVDIHNIKDNRIVL